MGDDGTDPLFVTHPLAGLTLLFLLLQAAVPVDLSAAELNFIDLLIL